MGLLVSSVRPDHYLDTWVNSDGETEPIDFRSTHNGWGQENEYNDTQRPDPGIKVVEVRLSLPHPCFDRLWQGTEIK